MAPGAPEVDPTGPAADPFPPRPTTWTMPVHLSRPTRRIDPGAPAAAARSRRPASLVAAALALALLAAACGGGGNKPAPQVFDKTTTPDGAEAPITTTPSTLADSKVSYLGQACPFNPASANGLRIDCGQLVVPMRRDQPTSKQVFLSVAVIRSTSPTPLPDPVIYLAGGPGGSAVAGVDMWTNPPTPILENRDLILIDQRGTGYSGPRLNCNRIFVESPTASEAVSATAVPVGAVVIRDSSLLSSSEGAAEAAVASAALSNVAANWAFITGTVSLRTVATTCSTTSG